MSTDALRRAPREVLGTDDPDEIDGRNDVAEAIRGLAGNDTLIGGKGDFLYGDEGDDRLSGAARIWGGAGDDTIGGEGVDVILRGEAGDDYIGVKLGSPNGSWLSGGVGDDRLFGGDGRDILKGGSGDDGLRGGVESDVLRGGAGNDGLSGENGSDTLFGGAGDDVLFAGRGAHNVLEGGSGSDRFDTYKFSTDSFTITDFSAEDRLTFWDFYSNTVFSQEYVGEDTVVTLQTKSHTTVITFQDVHLTGLVDPRLTDTGYAEFEGSDLLG